MPYYGAGDYYRAGDHYYGAGDFLGIGKAIKGAVKFVGGVARTVTGIAAKIGIPGAGIASAVANIVAPPRPSFQMMPYGGGMDVDVLPEGTPAAMIPAFAMTRPGRRPGDTGRIGHFKKDGTWTNRARPRMQVTNTRALKRAGRRVRGFLRVASKLGALPISRSGKGKLFKRKRR